MPARAARRWMAVAEEAAGCTRCDLYRRGTQTVFGAGPVPAPLVLVGEQPGDQEDLAGLPFVGPAGRLLDEVLGEAGLDAEAAYRTNAVKHFKWEASGKRRIHQRPDRHEVEACLPWLHEELVIVDPVLVVALGVTAAEALLERRVRVTRERGTVVDRPRGAPVLVTVHPASVLRARPRQPARDALVADLRTAAGLLDAARRDRLA